MFPSACHAYGETAADAVLVIPDRSVSLLVEEDDERDLGNIPLSLNANVRTNLCVDFTAIQT